MERWHLPDLAHHESLVAVHPGTILPVSGSHKRMDPVGEGADGGHPAAEGHEDEELGCQHAGLVLARRSRLLQELRALANLHLRC